MDKILYKDKLRYDIKRANKFFIVFEIVYIFICTKNVILGMPDLFSWFYLIMFIVMTLVFLPRYNRIRKDKYFDFIVIHDDKIQIRRGILEKKTKIISYKDINDIFIDKENVIIKYIDYDGKEKEFRISFYFVNEEDKVPLIEYFYTIKNNLKFFNVK